MLSWCVILSRLKRNTWYSLTESLVNQCAAIKFKPGINKWIWLMYRLSMPNIRENELGAKPSEWIAQSTWDVSFWWIKVSWLGRNRELRHSAGGDTASTAFKSDPRKSCLSCTARLLELIGVSANLKAVLSYSKAFLLHMEPKSPTLRRGSITSQLSPRVPMLFNQACGGPD